MKTNNSTLKTLIIIQVERTITKKKLKRAV